MTTYKQRRQLESSISYRINKINSELKLEGKEFQHFSNQFRRDISNLTLNEIRNLNIQNLIIKYSKKFGKKKVTLKQLEIKQQKKKKAAIKKSRN